MTKEMWWMWGESRILRQCENDVGSQYADHSIMARRMDERRAQLTEQASRTIYTARKKNLYALIHLFIDILVSGAENSSKIWLDIHLIIRTLQLLQISRNENRNRGEFPKHKFWALICAPKIKLIDKSTKESTQSVLQFNQTKNDFLLDCGSSNSCFLNINASFNNRVWPQIFYFCFISCMTI